MEVVPSPKSQKNVAKLPEAMAIDVSGANDVPFTSHKGLAVKLITGGGNIPRV